MGRGRSPRLAGVPCPLFAMAERITLLSCALQAESETWTSQGKIRHGELRRAASMVLAGGGDEEICCDPAIISERE